MSLKRHHKIIIGGVSSLLVIFMVMSTIFMYLMYTNQNMNFQELSNRIKNLQIETQTKFSDLSETVLNAETELKTLGSHIGSLDKEMVNLKASASADFSSVIEDSIKSVVTVRTDISQGSGFIIADGGYVVTNAHVMEDAGAAGVITYDGELHSVSIIGEVTEMDIILLQINGDYEPLELADSDEVQIGEKVIAIGNPLGLQFSVSEGIVSAVHRAGPNELEVYIQTDAALNPGNSGGPLINKKGEVIGINNFKTETGESLGFALESNQLRIVVNKIADVALGKTLI